MQLVQSCWSSGLTTHVQVGSGWSTSGHPLLSLRLKPQHCRRPSVLLSLNPDQSQVLSNCTVYFNLKLYGPYVITEEIQSSSNKLRTVLDHISAERGRE